MFILIITIIFTASFLGMAVILLRKVPVLVGLKKNEVKARQGLASSVFSEVFEGTKRISFEKYLHKILSKIRILTLKTDNKTSIWLQKLRQKSQERTKSFSDDYWKKVRGKK